MAAPHASGDGDLAAQLGALSLAGGSGDERRVYKGPDAAAGLAGMDPVLEALREVISWPQLYREEGAALGIRWPRGLLLHGPSGVGKTAAVEAVVREVGAVLHPVTAASLFGAYTGESERRLREVFEAAERDAARGRPVVVFLDDVDTLCPRRGQQAQHEARVVGQLLTLMDGAASRAGAGHVTVVAATSRPNVLDPALRRPGRLDREVAVPVPDLAARQAILRLLTRRLPLALDVDLERLAQQSHGYTGADLAALCREAAMHSLAGVAGALLLQAGSAGSAGSAPGPVGQGPQRPGGQQQQQAAQPDPLRSHHPQQQQQQHGGQEMQAAAEAADPGEQRGSAAAAVAAGAAPLDLAGLEATPVTAADFAAALRRVGPSVVRGAALDVAPVSWEDVGGLEDVKRKLRQAVEWPLQHADAFARLGLTPPRGVLLHGPPGCSKTTLARAAATASGATFIALSGAQLYSMYVGEGEAVLRDAFSRARLAAPSILFFDELDSLVGKRAEGAGQGHASTSDVSVRLLTSFLTEMDGLELAQGVLVLGATNRPQAIDAALLRPGRFDLILFVPPPDEAGREAALRIHTRGMPLAPDVDLAAVAAQTPLYTGAELAGICREAALAALREDFSGAQQVAARHFDAARDTVRPSLTPELLQKYESWSRTSARGTQARGVGPGG